MFKIVDGEKEDEFGKKNERSKKKKGGIGR